MTYSNEGIYQGYERPSLKGIWMSHMYQMTKAALGIMDSSSVSVLSEKPASKAGQ